MRSPPPSLGLGWPEDVPWRQKEPRTHVVPLVGAAALCPGHAPLPRASGGPGDIPLGWLRALRYLSKRWLRTGRWELLPGEAGRLFAAGTRGRLGAGRPGSPAHRRSKPGQGVSSEGLCSCLPVVGGNHSRHRGLDGPPRGAHPWPAEEPTFLPGFSRSLLVRVCLVQRPLEDLCLNTLEFVLAASCRVNKNCSAGARPGDRGRDPSPHGCKQFGPRHPL